MHRTEIDDGQGLILRFWRERLTAAEALESIRTTAAAIDPDGTYREIVYFDASIADADSVTLRGLLHQIGEIGVDERLKRSQICFVSDERYNAPLLRLWLELRDYAAVGTQAATFLSLTKAAHWLALDPQWLAARLRAMTPEGAA